MRFNSNGERNIEREEHLGVSKPGYKVYGLERIKNIKAKSNKKIKTFIQPDIQYKQPKKAKNREYNPNVISLDVERRFKQSQEKWSEENIYTLELERILDGRRTEYWKINDRLNALNNYLTSQSAESDKLKLNNIKNYSYLNDLIANFSEREGIKKAIEKGKLKKEEVDNIVKQIQEYVLDVKKEKLQEENKRKTNYAKVIPFKPVVKEKKKTGLWGKIAAVASIAIVGASSFASYISGYTQAQKPSEKISVENASFQNDQKDYSFKVQDSSDSSDLYSERLNLDRYYNSNLLIGNLPRNLREYTSERIFSLEEIIKENIYNSDIQNSSYSYKFQ